MRWFLSLSTILHPLHSVAPFGIPIAETRGAIFTFGSLIEQYFILFSNFVFSPQSQSSRPSAIPSPQYQSTGSSGSTGGVGFKIQDFPSVELTYHALHSKRH